MSDSIHLVVPGSLQRRTGGSRYDARVVEGLRARHWDVQVHELPGTFPEADGDARTALDTALASIPADTRVVVDGLALGNSPDIAEAHGRRLRLLALVHHPLADETGLDATMRDRYLTREPRTLAACRGVLVTSAHTARRITQMGFAMSAIRVIEPGTDPAPPARGPEPGEAPTLLCVGSITPRKGQDVLIDALSRLQALPWRCLIAGSTDADPAFAALVRERISAAGLHARIELPGECGAARLDRAYAQSSIFVLPSHYEGYGMVLAEALARGLPIVSTTGGAIPDTVPTGAGRLVPPGDAGELARALAELLTDDNARARASRASRRRGGALPTWTETARRFATAMEELA